MKAGIIGLIASFVLAHQACAVDYEIDPEHSQLGFKVKHLAISSVPGHFTQFTGKVSFDPAKIVDSKTEATISVGSINTSQKKRDDHLLSDDFFGATKFPEMKFKSKGVQMLDQSNFKVTGDLTIRDTTKPVTLDVNYTGAAKDPWGNDRVAFSATTRLNRKDFGLHWNKLLETGALVVGDDVQVNLEIEAVKFKKQG